MYFSPPLALDPIVPSPPQALVVLVADRAGSASMLAAKLRDWAGMVPDTAFLAFDGPIPDDAEFDVASISTAAEDLEALIEQQLHVHRVDISRVVLVGFGTGGSIALHLVLQRGWNCAGVLAYGAHASERPLALATARTKVRLIDCSGDDCSTGYAIVRELVMLLTAYGIDARGVALDGSMFSEAAVRRGGAYLVELVATAQRDGRHHVNLETSHAP